MKIFFKTWILFFQLVPLTQQEVDTLVSNFRSLREGVRANMPDLLIAVMTILYEQYNQAKAGAAGIAQVFETS